MTSIPKQFLSISKPILHETGVEEVPYAGVGTCFLVHCGRSGFIVTAKHVLNGYDAESLLVFPNPQTPISIPFNQFVQIAVTTAITRETYEMHGHTIKISTVDLSRPWPDIRTELLELVA